MTHRAFTKPLATLVLVLAAFATQPATGQVLDADCFSGACGGTKGVPQCPSGFEEVGWLLYANSKADANRDCETIVSCTNFGARPVEISCRFHHGFYPIRPGGPGAALCASHTPDVAPGDSTECATDATDEPLFQAGGIFLAGDAECPTFEGKGLICSTGNARRVFCEAHLVCGGGAVMESLDIIRVPPPPARGARTRDE